MLYHKDVKMPKRIRGLVPHGSFTLKYSNHAIKESNSDRYGKVQLPSNLVLKELELIEAEVYKDKPNKFVFRYNIDHRDLVIVIVPQKGRIGIVKTVWINLKNDEHKTLDTRRYVS